ncbi:2-phospho-L-lactate guanylyltransferase [Paraburkholderia antibiotica]|uniref:3-phospho-D-glycerate guanylyltransferase n=1 Tax=Paraburkholderia antibiotica TaxID=2728839 RepID=A0A7X9X6E9_9BURK|nr:2-phospho-L-lactate guanylyltransferase [Paraburkholderia antibiotica]NML32357.1 2-phospho-L-lactate guanylyltransferase [Paraburkholderia antibiotica]
MKTLVAIPMKAPARAKTRLAPAMNDRQRERLALLMFERTLGFFRGYWPDFDVMAVTDAGEIAALAERHGAGLLLETREAGLNAAAAQALRHALERGYERLVIVPGDVPVWLRAEVARVLALSRRHALTLAESYDGGTNLLALAPPQPFEFHYGPQSAARHARSARRRGLSVARCCLPFLARDIDTAADCVELAEAWAAGCGRGPAACKGARR